MQLLLDLSQIGHTSRLPKLIQPKESTAYIAVSGCVLDHIVVTRNLSGIEKLFFLLANSLSLINSKSGRQRTVALSAESWAKRLDCSKTRVFSLQQSLSDKGYFIITRDKNKHNQNKRNLICPTLPDSVFKELCKAPDRAGQEHLYFVPTSESKLEYLDRTKLFILLGYQVLKDISACEHLRPFHKLVWLDFYFRCYKSHMANFGTPSDIEVTNDGFSFITSYKQLEDRFNCDKRLLSETLIDLEEIGLIKRAHFYVKKECDDQDRQDKSLWKISLLSPEQLKKNPGNGESNTTSPFPSSTTSLNPINFSSKLLPIKSNTQSSLASKSEANDTKNKEHVVDSTSRNESNSRSIESKPETRAEQKSKINSTHEQYIENIVAELGQSDEQDTNIVDTDMDTQAITDLKVDEYKGFRDIRNIDPEFLSSTLYLNKDIIINNFKSNLGNVDNIMSSENNLNFKDEYISIPLKTSQCLNSNKEKELNQYGVGCKVGGNKTHRGVSRGVKKLGGNIHKASEFNVSSLLIKDKLKILSIEKADKARKFAYALVSKKLAKGYASTLSKHELAKQFIFHATSWKPTMVGRGASDDKLVDVALAVAWKAAVNGSWKEPLEWAKAKALQYEFLAYKRKFKESGIISHDLRSLESMINNLLGTNYALAGVITKGVEENAANEIVEINRAEKAMEIIKTSDSEIQTKNPATDCHKNRSTQINQNVLVIHALLSAAGIDIYSVSVSYDRENRVGQAINHHSLNDLNVNRAEERGGFRKDEDSTLVSQLDFNQINDFLNCHSEVGSATSITTDERLSRDLLEQQAYFQLSNNTEAGYLNKENYNEITPDNHQRYIVQLKLLEMYNKGELVIILQPNDQLANSSTLVEHNTISVLPVDNSISKLESGNDQEIIEGQEDLLAASDQPLIKDFIKIDQALSGILKSLKRGN